MTNSQARNTSTRLSYRRLRNEDAGFLVELLNSPGWLENIGDRGVKTNEQAIAYLQQKIYPHCTRSWTGPYAILLTGKPIGTIGIYERPGLEVPDLGFALLPGYMRKGYATEAAEWLIGIARAAGVASLSAIYLPTNTASGRLLEKLNFVPIKMISLPEDPTLLQYLELTV